MLDQVIMLFYRYITFNQTMPHHAMSAMKILFRVSRAAAIQTDLVNLFTAEEVGNEHIFFQDPSPIHFYKENKLYCMVQSFYDPHHQCII